MNIEYFINIVSKFCMLVLGMPTLMCSSRTLQWYKQHWHSSNIAFL